VLFIHNKNDDKRKLSPSLDQSMNQKKSRNKKNIEDTKFSVEMTRNRVHLQTQSDVP